MPMGPMGPMGPKGVMRPDMPQMPMSTAQPEDLPPCAASSHAGSMCRARTTDPRPALVLIRADEATRARKIGLFREAQTACANLPKHADRLNDHLSGSFKQFHKLYHDAKEGRAVRECGAPYSGPLGAPGVGNWLWALLAALTTSEGRHGNIWQGRTQPNPLGDGMESFLYVLYAEHTEESLALLEEYAVAASALHDLLSDVPPVIYYRLHWRQTWASLRECLTPWLCFDIPLAIADGSPEQGTGEG